jgi:hypothetical protein
MKFRQNWFKPEVIQGLLRSINLTVFGIRNNCESGGRIQDGKVCKKGGGLGCGTYGAISLLLTNGKCSM